MTFDLKKALLDGSTWATGPKKDAYFAALDRILELESALIEERANRLFDIFDCDQQNIDTTCNRFGLFCNFRECPIQIMFKDDARKELHSEGKI